MIRKDYKEEVLVKGGGGWMVLKSVGGVSRTKLLFEFNVKSFL